MEHRKVTLPNGLRVLVSEMPETRSVSLAVYVGIGSRIETKDDAGTSHFLEHMVFKGSAKRPTAADISQVIESKGGVVNASTDKEVTVFWSRVPARHYLVALDVIADLIRAPMLRPTDVESERNVIVEELRMYRDQPQDRVHTLVDELLYPRHPLGWEVAGREEVVLGMTADRLREFMQRGYAPSRTVVALAGPLRADEAIAAVDEALGALVPDAEIERVRDFAKGRLELRLEDTRGVSGWLAGQELFLGRVRSVEEVEAIIDGVTPADIQRVAREYLRPELAYLAAIGPRASLAAISPPVADDVSVVMAS